MSATFDNDKDADEELEIEFSSTVIIRALAADPEFILAVVDALRDELIVNARLTGDLFGKWAQKPTPLGVQPQPPATQRIF